MKKFLIVLFLLLCGNAFAQFRQGNITINVFRVDTTGSQIIVSDGDTLYLDMSNPLQAIKINVNGTTVFNIDATGTVYTATRYDAIGAVDLDIGSADVTDIQLITDGTGDAEVVLPAQSISGTEILNATIDSTDVTNTSIAATDLVNASVLNAKLAPASVDSNKIAASMVTSIKIKNGDVNNADLANASVDSNKVASSMITSTDIKDANVNNVDLATSSVDSNKVAPSMITSSDIKDGNVNTADLANSAVTGAKVAAATLDSSDIATNGINGANLRPNSVGASEIIETEDYTFATVALTVIDESSVSAGSNSFSGTATTDTVTVSGALITDLYKIELTGAGAPSANDFYRVEKTATGFVIHRSASGTSGLTYDWFRSKP